MAEFRPIMTQEEFDAAISDRIRREREAAAKKYGDYEDLRKQVADQTEQIGSLTKERDDNARKYAGYDKTVADLQAKVRGYETDSVKRKIAHETGIPFEMASRLSGETEADIRKDAELMARYMSGPRQPAPLRSSEPAGADNTRAAMTKMLHDMKGD